MIKEKTNKKFIAPTVFIILMGFVSLLSDMTHEGAASISGAYLLLLGASASAIGFVSGFGTLLGYGLRLLTGYLADKTKKYWTMTILGYAIDLLFIPFLALVPDGGWVLACGLLLVGKIGNAIKKPAKDTMISFAASENGQGKSFALLEFIDQLGAFLGPTLLFLIMILTTDMSSYNQYAICFAVLAIPAIACMILLFFSKRKFPHPENYEKENTGNKGGLKRTYIVYLFAVCIFAFGFIDFPLITAHESINTLVPTDYLPLLYSGAMLADAFSALVFGLLYDKYGFITLVISAILSAPFSILIFFANNMTALVFGVLMWGIGMGAQESIMKASIATLTSKANRSKGYGAFQLCFGLSWFLGSWLTGILYDKSVNAMIVLSVSAQIIAAVIFVATSVLHKKDKQKMMT
ncbi:MAG TPA: MFS transporter [Clostridia bacterium]|nr:MFS transporter [Clostridia bacterium]